MPVLAVELDEGEADFHRLLLGLDLAEKVGCANLDPAVPADMQFVAAIDANHAEILDCRFGTVPWAAADGHLELVRHVTAPCRLLQLDAEPGRILRAEAAPFTSHAGLHRAQRLAVGVAGHHAGGIEIGPDGGQVLFPDPEDVEPLAAGYLDHGRIVFFDHVGDGPQFPWIGDAAEEARDDRIGAVLLDVGVQPLVDKAALLVVLIFARPGAQQVVIERRAARGAAVGRGPVQFLHHLRDQLQFLFHDQAAHVVMVEAGACAEGLRAAFDLAAERQGKQPFDQIGATAAAGRSLALAADRIEAVRAVIDDAGDDLPLAHTVAAADFRIVGQGGDGCIRIGERPARCIGLAEDQRLADVRYVLLSL